MQIFEDLLRTIDGIKQILCKIKPLIIITTSLHEHSLFSDRKVEKSFLILEMY